MKIVKQVCAGMVVGVLALLAGVSASPAAPLGEILAKAEKSCKDLDGGHFDARDAVKNVDLTGDGNTDTVIDESRFQCSSARSLYCGSGGCNVHAVVGGKAWSFQAEGWRIVDWDGRPILLIMRDGAWCGGAGSQVCYEAVSWSSGRMMTVMPTKP